MLKDKVRTLTYRAWLWGQTTGFSKAKTAANQDAVIDTTVAG